MKTQKELEASDKLLVELLEAVSVEESYLGLEDSKQTATRALTQLRESQVKLGNPLDNLTYINTSLFDTIGIELNKLQKNQLETGLFNFYYMTITSSLKTKPSVLFDMLELQIEFTANDVIIQNIFPQTQWNDILNWGGQMTIALDGDLQWKIGMLQLPKIIPNIPNGDIVAQNELRAHVIVPSYGFDLGRFDILATGEGTNTCYWRISSNEINKISTASFIVLFKVPKHVTEIQISGIVHAETSFNWLAANIQHVVSELSDRIGSLLQGKLRIPIWEQRVWDISLPK